MRAIFVSDLHLQATAPVARSAEPDWFAAMARPLDEISNLQIKYNNCPVVYAGDIFDRWCVGPEVINFALAHLPRGYAIPGQHDLPNHNYDEIKRSAYWTLVEAGTLINISADDIINVMSAGIILRGFPWGFDPCPLSKGHNGCAHIAVIHKFIWTKDTGYPGAPPSGMVGAYRNALAGYDVAVFGDNHKGFIKNINGGPCIINCGGLMRRKTDERGYRPGVGLLLPSGEVVRHYLDTTADKFIEQTAAEDMIEEFLDMSEFANKLRGLGAGDALDFVASLKRFFEDNKTPNNVRSIILEACTTAN